MDFWMYITLYVTLTINVLEIAVCLNCTGRPDGVYESSCQSAIKCTNGTESRVDCITPEVVNEETGDCDNALDVKTPCGTFRDCSVRNDGGYPELGTQCHWYYVCTYGILYGHHKCSTGLVWNTLLQTCDFPFNVHPPCGTKN